MSSIFQNVVSKRPPRNNFNLTHELLTSGRIGNLIPVQCDLAVPGEFFHQSADFLMRFAPLAGAAMMRMNVHFHTFFVPLRLLTPRNADECGFNDFMLKVNASKEEIPILPRLVCKEDGYVLGSDAIETSVDDFRIGSLWDYFKLPTIPNNVTSVELNPAAWPKEGISLLPFIAYQKIYDDWYRRDQIQKRVMFPRDMHEIDIIESEGRDFQLPDDWEDESIYESSYPNEERTRTNCIKNLFRLRQRNYERDYFTSALPEPQFGDDVLISDGSISSRGESILEYRGLEITGGTLMGIGTGTASLSSARWKLVPSPYGNYNYALDSDSQASVDLNRLAFISTGGNGGQLKIEDMKGSGFFPTISVNQFRVAMQMQGVVEMINRGGTRFKEFSNMIYHVDIPDARLQRVEYVGGFKSPIQIGTVVQTSETTTSSPLGTLAGKATGAGSNLLSKGKHLCWEHGYYITLMSVTPRTSYYGGIPRMFSLNDPIDYYLPQFDRLGEDAIYNRELQGDIWNVEALESERELSGIDGIFGYTPMYSYLKSSTSSVTGEFRDTLSYLHASRSFNNSPTLSPEFITCDPRDFDRLFDFENINGTSNEQFYVQIVFRQIAKKPMSKYSTPLTLM